MQRPTDDEIERVEAWRAERNRTSHLAYRAKMEEREAQARAAVAEKLVGRTITAVDGEVDGEDWHKLVLSLDDRRGSSELTISMVGWDEKTLDLNHKEGTDA